MHMQVALLIHLIHFHISVFQEFQEFQEHGSRARANSVIPIPIISVKTLPIYEVTSGNSVSSCSILPKIVCGCISFA